MIEHRNLPAGGRNTGGPNLTDLWSGSGVEQTMEKLGHDGGRLEYLVTLRSNRSVDHISYGEEREKNVQHWTLPVLQEFEITFTRLGTAATKIAMEAVAKRASLENMFMMSGDLVGE